MIMYKSIKAGVFFVLLSLASAPAWAQATQDQDNNNTNVTVDVTKLDDTTRNAVLDAIAEAKKKAAPVATTAQTVKEWAGFGKDIGDAVAATAKSLGVAVNDFIKTPAGRLVVWIILIKLFGGAIWGILTGTIVWLILGALWWKSFNRFLFGILNKKTGERTPYPYNRSQDSPHYPGKIWAVILHIVAGVLICVMCGPAVIYAFW